MSYALPASFYDGIDGPYAQYPVMSSDMICTSRIRATLENVRPVVCPLSYRTTQYGYGPLYFITMLFCIVC